MSTLYTVIYKWNNGNNIKHYLKEPPLFSYNTLKVEAYFSSFSGNLEILKTIPSLFKLVYLLLHKDKLNGVSRWDFCFFIIYIHHFWKNHISFSIYKILLLKCLILMENDLKCISFLFFFSKYTQKSKPKYNILAVLAIPMRIILWQSEDREDCKEKIIIFFPST